MCWNMTDLFLGCTDIDDALHVRELGNGNYEVHASNYLEINQGHVIPDRRAHC